MLFKEPVIVQLCPVRSFSRLPLVIIDQLAVDDTSFGVVFELKIEELPDFRLEPVIVNRTGHLDPLVHPIATDHTYGTVVLRAIERIMTDYPGVHTVIGLSNVSYGLPFRFQLNQIFLVLALGSGLDSAILCLAASPPPAVKISQP